MFLQVIANNCTWMFWMFFSWTPNHYAFEAIGYYIRSSFRGLYDHYNAM